VLNSLLAVKAVKKSYERRGRASAEALKGVSLDLYEGEVLSLLGVNGAGKTTLSSIIASLIPASSGEVLWKGKSIYQQLKHYRQIVGFCPQKPNLDPILTLEQNLLFAGRFFGMDEAKVRKQVASLLDRFELRAYAQEQASVLSGGYKQRFLIARTLIHSPKLVILDEPTVGLDPHIRHELWDGIKDLRQGKVTVILTTHYLEEAEALSDRVCMIDEGEVQTIDTPAQIKRTFGKENLEDVLLAIHKRGRP